MAGLSDVYANVHVIYRRHIRDVEPSETRLKPQQISFKHIGLCIVRNKVNIPELTCKSSIWTLTLTEESCYPVKIK